MKRRLKISKIQKYAHILDKFIMVYAENGFINWKITSEQSSKRTKDIHEMKLSWVGIENKNKQKLFLHVNMNRYMDNFTFFSF